MSKLKLSIIVTFAIAIIAGGVVGFTSGKSEPASAANGDGCPAGSYNIGISKDDQPICKLEPTGCPFGDSIPLDSPKCAPPADIECNADWTVCNPKTVAPVETQVEQPATTPAKGCYE